MDYLHAKVASDLHDQGKMTEDEFYQRHSCVWLQGFKNLIRRHRAGRRDREVEPTGKVAIKGA